MGFQSLWFPVFLGAVLLSTRALAPERRWWVLLPASYLFYGLWNPAYCLLLAASTTVDYSAARAMQAGRGPRRAWLALSLVTNLGLLGTFKYLPWMQSELTAVAPEFVAAIFGGRVFEFLLPVGISFYTFQTLGYTIDVYRGQIPAERHFGRFALFVSFFPQLVAGPIERAGRLLTQLHRIPDASESRLTSGARLVLWGLFKKLAVANTVAGSVDMIFDNPTFYSVQTVLACTYLFAIQIYCDFSGYCDIAQGAARMLGIELMDNFRQPYFAVSMRDFWRRWHVSLGLWFRDYLYMSLGGGRQDTLRWLRALGAVFLLSGLWHGANWTFLVWGAYHGVLVAIEGLWSRHVQARLPEQVAEVICGRVALAVRRLAVFHLVLIGWVVFRATSLANAEVVMGRALRGFALVAWSPLTSVKPVIYELTKWPIGALGVLILILAVFVVDEKATNGFSEAQLDRWRPWTRRLAYAAVALAIVFVAPAEQQAFIYFRF